MRGDDMEDVYRRFAALYADSEPIRTKAELRAAIDAEGLALGSVSHRWLRSLKREWVYKQSDEPFTDPRINRAYRRLVAET